MDARQGEDPVAGLRLADSPAPKEATQKPRHRVPV